ncbi:helix-turn-helix domain-containing protein [Clostridium isatidis]|uniref:DNA-binding protein n=1 Tax=Clostridium isatidis TaxID=182773 RepID=A0A343J8Z9_9CLOT|nr:helix-turn-helix transcriptional regulator [Clostridium isatidis]ASW42007.1 DNA-binding protein [Clostridium isatidis]NLZ34006.1 helix-turn-helix transcriptional regulator [Clostridiales bacterium]
MSRVGEKIKEARLKSGLSQKQLAKKLGVAEKFINEVEIGRRVAPESLIEKAAKILNTDFNDISMNAADEVLQEEKKNLRGTAAKRNINKNNELDQVWTNAFSSVLKNVPIYDYSLSSNKGFKEMPIHSNKIEGFAQDKVIYLEIENDEMSGFRMLKGDLAFAYLTKEIVNNGIFLVDYKGKRAIRQIKALGNSKLLIVSNGGSLLTETVEQKEIDIIAKLVRLEIKL